MTTYRIAEAAELVGVPASTLRYYEEIGLVARPSRDDNGYRTYDERDIGRLQFVGRARRLGLGVGDLRELVEVWETDDCSAVQHRMAEVVAIRLMDTQGRLVDLVEITAELQSVAARLRGSPAGGPCGDECPCISQSAGEQTLVPLARGEAWQNTCGTVDGRPAATDASASQTAFADCALSPEDIEGQLARVMQLRPAIRRIERSPGRLTVAFEPGVDTEALARLVAIEQECGGSLFELRYVESASGPEVRYSSDDPAREPLLADLARYYDAVKPAAATVPEPLQEPSLVPMPRENPVLAGAGSPPIACSLDARFVRGRFDEWQAVLAKAISRSPVDGGLALQFDADPDTGAELGRLAVAEKACCAFFDFRLRAAGLRIEFEVRSPPEASEVVTALFGTTG